MPKVKFELNSAGVRELLKSEKAAVACREHAARIQRAAGEGYVMEDRHYPERTGAAVRPDTAAAAADNLKHNTLLKALGGGS